MIPVFKLQITSCKRELFAHDLSSRAKRSDVEGSRERTQHNATGFVDYARNNDGFKRVRQKLVLEVPLDAMSMKLEIHEIFLVGEARARFLFVV